MKIALIISGQPRFYKSESYRSIRKNILNKYDTDVYFHTWRNNKPYEVAPWSEINTQIVIENSFESELIFLYNPKNYIIEDQKEFPEISNIINDKILTNHHNYNYSSKNMPSMFYSLEKSYELVINSNIIYDWIIRLRFDTIVPDDLPDLNNFKSGKCIYIPNNCPSTNKDGGYSRYNDNFSITNINDNNVYNIFKDMKNYTNEILNNTFVGEDFWSYHIWKNKYKVELLNIDLKFVRS